MKESARLLRSLGVFVGGCDLEAIEAVSALGQQKCRTVALLPTLHALIGKSLVRAETTAGRRGALPAAGDHP